MLPAIPEQSRSFWMSIPDELCAHRTTTDLPQECDIAIIGSGYAGASVSYYLQKSFSQSILMLEARETCSGATGRNGGHLKPDAFYSFNKYASLYGDQEAERLLQFEQDHIKAMRDLIQEEQIDCDFVLTRAVDVFMTESEGKYARNSLLARQKAGGNIADISIIPQSDLERFTRLKSKPAFGASYPAGSLHPYKFVHHLLRKAIQQGMNLQTNTPVLDVVKSGEFWFLTTKRGIVKAKKCIFATNAYTGGLLPILRDKIIPVKGTVSQISLPQSFARLKNTYGIRTKGADSDYMICRQDGTIILGGAKSTFLHQPKLWYDVLDDSNDMCSESQAYFETYFAHHFGEPKTKCERVWTGILGYSSDFLPYVGEIPSDHQDQSGGFVIAGFHGHGMPRVLLCAKALAAQITGQTSGCEGLPKAYLLSSARLKIKTNHILEDMTAHLPQVKSETGLASKTTRSESPDSKNIHSNL